MRRHERAEGARLERSGCLAIPRFPLAYELMGRPELRGQPVVVAKENATVWAVSPAAERFGVRADQPLREALSRCPTLAVVEGRPARYEALAETITAALQKVVSGVEPGPQTDRPGGVIWLDLQGLEACYPNPETLWSKLLGCAPRALHPRLGVAPGRMTSLIAARAARAGTALVVTTTELRSFLTAQPVAGLPITGEMVRRLRLLGVTTLGELRTLPRTAFIAQFGPQGAVAHALANGEDLTTVQPRRWQERIVEALDFEVPLVSREAVQAAVDQLLCLAFQRPPLHGSAPRRATLRLETEAGQRWERTITIREPLADRHQLGALLRPLLASAATPGPVSRLVVELDALVRRSGWQVNLFADRGQRQARLEEALRHLTARHGKCPVSHVVTTESWNRIPERRTVLTAAFTP